MPDHNQIQDPDFDTQLRGLFQEAEQNLEGRTLAAKRVEAEKDKSPAKSEAKIEVEKDPARQHEEKALRAYASLPQMLRPLVQGLEAATRAAGENKVLLNKIGEKLEQKIAEPEQKAGEVAEAQKALPDLIENLRGLLEQKNTVNQKMFAALHEELKGYKDGFLLESVHKPIIRDLISLYDDLTAIHSQMQETVVDAAKTPGITGAALLERLKTMDMNIEHNCEFLIEVLARLEVTLLPVGEGKLDMHTQRALAVEIAEDPDDDGMIVRTLKRGFLWKGRVVRPEEVVMKKWKEGFLVALAATSSQK
jgi:molecular chaperone GrpE (heat shock protein)